MALLKRTVWNGCFRVWAIFTMSTASWRWLRRCPKRALRGKEKAWGPDHTSTLDTVNDLGNLYKFQAKLEEAEKMYGRALQGYEKAFGSVQICYST
jgi:hypothetical protein